MVDTNSDPSEIDFVIPANDDAAKSISLVVNIMCQALAEGLNERKAEKDKESSPAEKESCSRKVHIKANSMHSIMRKRSTRW